MIIAVNTRLLLINRLEGIGWFTFESLKRIVQNHPEHQFFFIFDRPYDASFIFSDNVKPVVLGPPTRHPFLWFFWLEFRIPRLLKKLKADLFFSPDGFLSLSSNIKSIATIHDINFEHRPKDIPLLTRWYYLFFFRRFAKKACRITTVSEYSKNDIVKTYGIVNRNIDVVYNGSNEMFKPLSKEIQINTRNKLTGGQPYFIFIGALHPRKNICNLLQAFDVFKTKSKAPHKLLIVGSKMFKNRELKEVYSRLKHQKDVVFTGRLKTEELNNALGSAEALTFVPFFEGFGIPVLEAMYSEVPVIASNVTSLPEVAGEAALFADPNNIESIAECMQKITENEKLRKTLVEKGRKQRQNFSWDRTAEMLWESFEKCLNA